MHTFEAKTIPMREICPTPHTQVRATLHQDVIEEYAEAMRNGVDFPPVTVFFDGFAEYWIADGWHRYRAAADNGAQEIAAEVAEGTERDALWHAVTKANRAHGVRRTNADKRRTVEILLRDPEWSQFSDRKLAREAGVSHTMVAEVRQDLAPEEEIQLADSASCEPPAEPAKRVGQDGKARKAPEPRKKQAAKKSAPAKPKPKKNGAEKIAAEDRRNAKSHWGQFVRILQKTGWLEQVSGEVEAISALVNKECGR